jgi:pimeloyl-ACP methyl ester carboxylesterase
MTQSAGIMVGCLATVLLVSACVSADNPGSQEQTSTEVGDYYDQTLAWEACSNGAECSQLRVPKDYDDLSRGEFDLALLRHAASGASSGSLVINPGGPGGSGVGYASAADQVLSQKLSTSFDVIGFDPRGVAASDPVTCLTDEELDEWLAADGKPDNSQEIDELTESTAQYGSRCEERAADGYAYVDTQSVVRDLDVLRSALGEDKLDYLGKSYGTLIGTMYAEEFPDKIGRMVLDGVLPPDLSSEEIGLGQAKGFEDTLRRFVKDCQSKPDCPLPKGSVDDGVKRIQTFLDDLGEDPIKAAEGRPLTQSLGLGSILYHLYFPAYGDWVRLSDGLADAFKGDGSTLLQMYDLRLQRDSDGNYADNSNDAFNSVTCLDREGEADTDVLQDRARDWGKQAPTFGSYLAWSDLVCGQWPVGAKGSPHEVSVAGANPILVVSTTHDPATPYPWAKKLAADLDRARLVTWEQDGHTAYANGSSCVDDVVDAYLINGTVPKKDVSCPE